MWRPAYLWPEDAAKLQEVKVVPLTETERLEAIDWCLRKSWRVRLTPQTSRVLIHDCLDCIEKTGSIDPFLAERMEVKARHAARRVWRPVKSAWVVILLQIVLPAIIRLVIEWWLNRKRSKA